jgi:hypothetical protein
MRQLNVRFKRNIKVYGRGIPVKPNTGPNSEVGSQMPTGMTSAVVSINGTLA